MKEIKVKHHPWKTWAPGRKDVSSSPPSTPAEADIPMCETTAAWQKISRENQTPPAYDYSSIPNPDLKRYMEGIERGIQGVRMWPLTTNQVTQNFLNLLELDLKDTKNSLQGAFDYKVINPTVVFEGRNKYYRFEPDHVRAFAVFCWTATGPRYQPSLPTIKERTTKAKEALGPHPLANLINWPTPIKKTGRSANVSEAERRTPTDEERTMILTGWTRKRLLSLNLTIPPNLDQVRFSNGLPFEVTQSIMFALAVKNRNKGELARFDPSLRYLTNAELKGGIDLCLIAMDLRSDKYPTLSQLYDKAKILAEEWEKAQNYKNSSNKITPKV